MGTDDEHAAPPPRTPAWKRRGRRLALLLVALAAFYLIAANIFLLPQVGPASISRKPDKLQIDWQRGWSLWPGRVHLTGLRLDSRTRRQRLHLELDEAHVSLVLRDLLARRLCFTRVRGRGLVVELVPRTDEIPPAGQKQARRKGWHLVLDQVHIDEVREIGLQHHRYQGEGTLAGHLSYQVRGPLRVDHARLELLAGRVSVDGRLFADVDHLTADLRVDPFVPRDNRGLAALAFVSGTLAAEAPRADLAMLDFFFRGAPWLELTGEGSMWLDLGLEHGHLTPESRARAEARVDLRYLDYQLSGDSRIDAEVHEVDGTVESFLEVTFAQFELGEKGLAEPHVRGQGAAVRGTTQTLDLSEPRPQLEVLVHIPQSEVPRLTYYNRFLPTRAGLAILAGRGQLRSRLQMTTADSAMSGEVEISGQDIDLQIHDFTVRGDLHLQTKIPQGNIATRRFEISGTRLRLENASLATKTSRSVDDGWWASLELADGQVDLQQPLTLTAKIAAELRDTSPLVTLLEKDHQRPQWLRRLLTIEDVKARGQLAFQKQAVRVDDLEIDGRRLEVLGHLLFAEPGLRALLFCKYRGLSAAVEIDGQKRDWDLVKSRRWFERRAENWPDAATP